MSKLIMINGAAGVGKTTIADRYAEEHPFTLNFAGDVLIEMISGWRDDESRARELVFDITRATVEEYLKSGNNVIIQYLLTDPAHAEVFEKIAEENDVSFYEVILDVDKTTAVKRLLSRGCWGEANSPKLSADDVPEIEALYDSMSLAASQRPKTIKIPVIEGDIEGTYQQFKDVIN